MGIKNRTLTQSLFILMALAGCATIPSPQERLKNVDEIVEHHPLTSSSIKTSAFNLFSVSDNRIGECADKNLKVYIEGDGLSWISSSRISDNPTPINPLMLKLMVIDHDPCKVYIARPCQYVSSPICNQEYWTNKRFGNDVISTYQEALNYLKESVHNRNFILIGYSGGGAIALLTAAKREDVQKIVTIAGNIDTDIWVKNHHLSPLIGSLNPADYAKQIENIEQWHFIGKEDTVVPKYVFDSYLSQCANRKNIHFKEVDATHSKNWEIIYSDLLSEFSF